MDLAAKLDDLMNRFSELGNTSVGLGPSHPTTPAPDLAPVFREVTTRFPFLRTDEGYLMFLNRYDGAKINEPSTNRMIWVAGLTYISSDILGNGYPLTGDDGFFEFGDTQFTPGAIREPKRAISVGFAINTTKQRRPGVYKDVIVPGRVGDPPKYEWCCDNFVTWLSKIIELKGQLT